uniref:Ovule protein n=1 Tax=Ascaris lumbricoides TaxID=6252 RepID=A0A0M3IUP2_ASCLU
MHSIHPIQIQIIAQKTQMTNSTKNNSMNDNVKQYCLIYIQKRHRLGGSFLLTCHRTDYLNGVQSIMDQN